MRRILLLLSAALSGCTVGPDYHGSPSVAPNAIADGRFVRAADNGLEPAPVVARWWEGLGDALLTSLIDEALQNSPTIDRALARLKGAQAQMRQTRSARSPTLGVNGTYVHADVPASGLLPDAGRESLDIYHVGLSASWELDLFGGTRRGIERSQATAAARLADLGDVQVSLSAQVAQAYVDLRAAQTRLRIGDASIDLQKRQLALTRERVAGGTATRSQVEQQAGGLETSVASRAELVAQRDALLNQLAVLTGREPGALDSRLGGEAAIPLPPVKVAIGDPAGLIARRPDVRAAERELAASTANIGVYKAQELPVVRFLGLLGLGGSSAGDIANLHDLSSIAVASLSWSFLDFGRSHAATNAAEAQRDEAAAAYRQAVLAALQDAETALSRFGQARTRLGALVRAREAAARSAVLQRERVSAGTSSVIDRLSAEEQRLSAGSAVAVAQADLTDSYIAVSKALGLGWSGQEVPGKRQQPLTSPYNSRTGQ